MTKQTTNALLIPSIAVLLFIGLVFSVAHIPFSPNNSDEAHFLDIIRLIAALQTILLTPFNHIIELPAKEHMPFRLQYIIPTHVAWTLSVVLWTLIAASYALVTRRLSPAFQILFSPLWIMLSCLLVDVLLELTKYPARIDLP
ncbi:MAG: hypothetical protein WC003_16740 [Terrimicrobiaceae bacterium]|nr:hypothetical protein [Terrimicrobiaceae bacterium]